MYDHVELMLALLQMLIATKKVGWGVLEVNGQIPLRNSKICCWCSIKLSLFSILSTKITRQCIEDCRFSYAGTWELVNLFIGTNIFSYHIYYENIGRKHSKLLKSQETNRPRTDKTEQHASKVECIKWNN